MTEMVMERLSAQLETVRESAQARLSTEEASAYLDALTAIMDQAAPDEAARETPEALFGATHGLWGFGAVRRPGEARLRFYHPEAAAHGWTSDRTIVEVVNDDMPFLVDSVTALIADHGQQIHSVLHPILHIRRGPSGERLALAKPGDPEAIRESWIQIQLDRVGDLKSRTALETAMAAVLADVRVAVADWKTMLTRLREASATLRATAPQAIGEAAAEAAEFLDWLGDDHFTFLGCRDYVLRRGEDGALTAAGSGGLGLMRDPNFTILRDAEGRYADWTPEMDAFTEDDDPLLILKANRRSTVHRTTHLDFIGVKRFDEAGRVVGEQGFIGLFTSAAYNRSPVNIPMLRGKVSRIIESAGLAPDSHDGKALAHMLETHPRDELLQASEEQLRDQSIGALHLITRPRTRLFVRPDRFGRFYSCLVYAPRERYDTSLRIKIGEILCEALDGRIANFTPAFGGENLIRVHFVIAVRIGARPEYDLAAIEQRIVEAVRDWSDGLREALIERFGGARGAGLHGRYRAAFSAGYREAVRPQEAAADISKLETIGAESPIACAFYRLPDDSADTLRFKLYRLGGAAPLSDVMPILENMGLRVLEEHPHQAQRRRSGEGVGPGGRPATDEIHIHDFLTQATGGVEIALEDRREVLESGFEEIWRGACDDDPLNRLMVAAGLSARRVALLRAFSRFLRQARISYSVDYMEDALAQNPGVAASLVSLFETLFDPASGLGAEAREAQAERIGAEIETALDAVTSLDVDRILRRFRNAILATLRTNYFQIDADGAPKDYFSFKFDSGALDELPAPRPWREIFVYSSWVEGVHLRGGPVARGGLRWSDRKEDFRTEVLGLVKAQQVKNAVIVPVGSKGGFLPKRLPRGGTREEIQAEAIRSYRTFLSGLLDITDNLKDGASVAPPLLVRRDADDPYLVVAADKGTASFSDIANDVAAEYRFWLGDAFASGGSVGYDHKGMGITARGGWEAVKRHFRELGHDTQTEPFTVVGVGDMSGDVFGNGMLLSDQIKLIAAFDHRDIFIDPTPDPSVSFAERKRLFDSPRSSWKDYDESLISQGGGVFSRGLKAVKLTPEIQALTGLAAESVAPYELIKALLKTEADLLWFGGIGTYVKAREESHAEVGDRANDLIRVDAGELGARVIGEGANLGVTQLGRMALSARGVKLNTDAVDNAAGVDCSDHEVNIKIALGAAMAAGAITPQGRNALLAEMTDEVAALVLASNYAQTGALSQVEAAAPALLEEHIRFMRAEEAAGALDRAVERLPSDEELAERGKTGRGLTRPELAVLLAYAKLGLYESLLASDLPDEPYLERWLIDYFPSALRDRFPEALRGHRLRREIIATVVANTIVNEGGPTLMARLAEETGADAADCARAFLTARALFGFGDLSAEIDSLDNQAAAESQIAMRAAVARAQAVQCARLLQRAEKSAIGALLDRFGRGVSEISYAAEALLSDFSRARLETRKAALSEAGAPDGLAGRIATLEFLGGAMDMVATAERLDRGVIDAASTYFAVGARFGLDWLRISARALEPQDDWERLAIGRLVSDLRDQQSGIAAAALQACGRGGSGASCVAIWEEGHERAVARADRLLDQLKRDGSLSVAKLSVAASQLRGCI